MSTPTTLELVRNRDFSLQSTGWHFTGTGSGVGATGQDGGPALTLEGIFEKTAGLYQMVHWPDQFSAVTIAFDYNLQPTSGGTAQLVVWIVTDDSGVVGWTAVGPTGGATGWQRRSITLTGQEVDKVLQAHNAGARTYLAIELQQVEANMFRATVDNVSVQVDGEGQKPDWPGEIAYIGADVAGNPSSLRRIAPAGGTGQSIWTHPGPGTPRVLDVTWQPNGTQLAFSSNHESGYSAYQADAYAIGPDGSGLRRITNPPMRADLPGSYGTGTVTGRVYNDYGTAAPFLVYVQGAADSLSLALNAFQQETPFAVANVADLGPGILQYVVFSWSSQQCADGREFAVSVVDVVAGQSVDAGTLTFHGYCNTYEATDLSWRRDGSALGFVVGSQPRRAEASGQTIGSELFGGTVYAASLAWSPTDDRIVFYQGLGAGSAKGYYLTTAGGQSSSQLLEATGILGEGADWLPDGSGFVYADSQNLYQYLFAGKTTTRLTNFANDQRVNFHEGATRPSLSPDGKYIVFERVSYEVTPAYQELWIVDRTAPHRMWPLVTDGRSGNPDWGQPAQAPSHPVYLPAVRR